MAAVARSLAEYALIPSLSTEFVEDGLNISAAATPPITTIAMSATNQIGCLLRLSTTTVSPAGAEAAATAAAGAGAVDGAMYGAALGAAIRPASSLRNAVLAVLASVSVGA